MPSLHYRGTTYFDVILLGVNTKNQVTINMATVLLTIQDLWNSTQINLVLLATKGMKGLDMIHVKSEFVELGL